MNELAFQQHNINKAFHCGLPFAIWSLPGSSEIHQLFCEPQQLIKTYSLNQLDRNQGFVFAPFQICKHLPIYIIPFNSSIQLESYKCNNPRKKINAKSHFGDFELEKSKNEHIRQVNLFLDAFKQTGMQKAVLSRSKWLPKYTLGQMPFLFEKLQQIFPDAFVYQIFIPDVGYWVGATPELLFSTHNGKASTVSLAGTQPLKPINDVTWDHKEMIEQELVTEHIRSVLNVFNISNIEELGPETLIAGNILHLKTILEFSKENIVGKVGQFIDKLHPTPAVCGLPVKNSLELILETEGYDREYYTGFLGPFDPSKNIDLFVNLRCLQAFDNGVLLYAGGGITSESDPDKEWEETRIKIQTLEQILENIYP
jgi:isochorismate synthase